MAQSRQLREFLQGRSGVIDSYQADWHGRGFPEERIRVRVDLYPDRSEIVGSVLERVDNAEWQPVEAPARPGQNHLTPPKSSAPQIRAF
jgi:hypothetical protein